MASLGKIARRITAPLAGLPDFLVIGAMKGGTSSLFSYLAAHPRVAVSRKKEVHFFDDNYARGATWYRSHFPLRMSARGRAALRWGEASPYYLFHRPVAERVAALLPEVKLVALLRDPVARAWSHYQHMSRKGWEDRPFAEAVDAEMRHLESGGEAPLHPSQPQPFAERYFHYVMRGFYADQLAHWYAVFDVASVFVVRSEDFFEDPAAIYAETLEFLGLPEHRLSAFPVENAGHYTGEMDPATRERLRRIYEPHNERLQKLVGWRLDWGV